MKLPKIKLFRGKTFKVMVAIPANHGVEIKSIYSLIDLEKSTDPKIELRFVSNEALIDRARSVVASRFLESDCDVLVFIDSDIIFKPFDVIKIARLCYEEGLDIVGGPYLKKTKTAPQFTFMSLNGEEMEFGSGGGVYEVRAVPTGFMAINRKVFEKMKEKFPLCNPKSLNFYPFFIPEARQIDGEWIYLGEDWAFTERARDYGFKCWVDTRIELKHVGPYEYDFDDMFLKRSNVKDFSYRDTAQCARP